MKIVIEKNILNTYNDMFEELYVIDSLINITKHSCLELECNGEYYGLDNKTRAFLSQERNNYINVLTLLSEKVKSLCNTVSGLELESNYMRIPTIAADK